MAGQAAVLTMVRYLSRLAPSSSSTPRQAIRQLWRDVTRFLRKGARGITISGRMR